MADCSTLGAMAEMKATIYLIGLGYDVFKNTSPSGPADLVAWSRHSGEIMLIDVKTIRQRVMADGRVGYNPFPKVKHDLVRHLGYCPETDEFFWSEN